MPATLGDVRLAGAEKGKHPRLGTWCRCDFVDRRRLLALFGPGPVPIEDMPGYAR